MKVNKRSDGHLDYAGGGEVVNFNTLRTRRGGLYEVTLSDGTQVWLNAASAITYPTVFRGHDRVVQMEVEAYFEVAADTARPFRVQVGDSMSVAVAGTVFDIMAYKDDPEIKTTLVRGAVRVHEGISELLLRPGEQAVVAQGGGPLRLVWKTDTAVVVAWMNGYFEFQDIDLQTLMRQIGRWYDVDITYDVHFDQLKLKRITGKFSRTVRLESLLNELGEEGMRFRVEGTTVHVLP